MLLERLEQIETSKMVFFVGAGISVGSGLPNFQQLSKKVIQDITGDKLEDREAEFLSQNLRPEVILQIAVEELGSIVLRSLNMLINHKPNPNHFFLAEALRLGNWVFTTNQDSLIEKAAEARGINFQRCYEDTQFEEYEKRISAGECPEGCLFKLHGTIEEDKPFEERFNNILMALRQVGRGLSEPKQRILSYFLPRFDFCFIGYGCQDDFSVTPVLLNTESDRNIFWLKYAGSTIDEPISDKSILQRQKEAEESKAPGEKRDWETINVNNFLLKRDKAFKFIGDSSRFLEDIMCPALGIDISPVTSAGSTEEDEEYIRWVAGISNCKHNLIAGRLYQSLYDLEKANHFYEQADRSATGDEERAIAQRRLGQIYLIPSTQDGDEKAIEVFQKAIDALDDPFETACTKTDLSNAIRRRKRFPEAMNQIEESRQIFENILASDGNEEHNLAYARCLNILGLVHYSLGSGNKSEESLKTGLDFCGKSRRIKERFGDVDGMAESDNASGLILMEQAILPGRSKSDAIRLLNSAIESLEGVVNTRVRIGNFRGCFQPCRNLGLAHSRLANLAGSRDEKERYTRLVRKDYENGMSYLNRIRPEPPLGEILECQFRIGELDVQLGEMGDAIRMLEPVELKRREPKEWHNRARTLDLLREAYADTGQKKRTSSEILSIYRDVLVSEKKVQEIKAAGVKLTNAKDILQRAADTFKSIVEPGLEDEALRIREELIKKVEQNDDL